RRPRYRFADLAVESAIELPELPLAEGTPAGDAVQITWEESAAVVEVQADWFHQWGADPIWARFGATDAGYVVEFPGLTVFRIDAHAASVHVTVAPDVPQVTARHLLLNQVLPLVLSHRGRTVIHAGAVAIAGEVTAFV